jgi:hypothetical protein
MLSHKVASFPGYLCSFPLSRVSANLLNKLSDLHIYLNDELLTYVITSEGKGMSEVFKLIVIAIASENQEFLYIEPEESILCLDQTRQYYFVIDEAELYHCRTTTTGPISVHNVM